jgi:hypothetical protein
MDIKKITLMIMILLPGCANQDWRHGNYNHDPKVNAKREKHRDKQMNRATDFRVGTAKHYTSEHKKRDGKLNLFYHDGFDWDF